MINKLKKLLLTIFVFIPLYMVGLTVANIIIFSPFILLLQTLYPSKPLIDNVTIDQLRKEITDKSKEIGSLNTNLTQLQTTISTLENENKNLETKNKKLTEQQSEQERLITQINILSSKEVVQKYKECNPEQKFSDPYEGTFTWIYAGPDIKTSSSIVNGWQISKKSVININLGESPNFISHCSIYDYFNYLGFKSDIINQSGGDFNFRQGFVKLNYLCLYAGNTEKAGNDYEFEQTITLSCSELPSP